MQRKVPADQVRRQAKEEEKEREEGQCGRNYNSAEGCPSHECTRLSASTEKGRKFVWQITSAPYNFTS
ncbi:jg27679 [Pararge aegeria aegeria]|uniref:Jg27679 protein n=1 Tax=Pararge aegeria aegeria TaxID=348720 RepID=A0A8S4QUK2_9NEOP|nr:jg27679 [Pararge aegeria aegeria]